MLRLAVVVLLGSLLAGCAGAADGTAELGTEVPPGLAVVRGVVVDAAIRPVADVEVTLTGGGLNKTAKTDGQGVFSFEVPPGNYLLRADHFAYREVTVSVSVVEGEESTAKILLERLFTQEAYHETLKFDGFIQCGYSITGVMSSLCVNDYTHFVGPYTCPECEHLFDRRSTNFAVGAGWQTMVFEMTWDPTAQGTSDRMRLTISHFPRSASHWYCGGADADPVLVRMEVGVECEDQQDEPTMVPPEGLPNMHLFAATSAPDGQPASAAFSQSFTVFTNLFYYGKPPEDWSFIQGSGFPF
ncbi:MAG: carboxypeptidase-like regulatory domain-containing protein [Candidatus Thermoplasmatota archaeon]|jgi:hypothetical protein